MQTPSPQDDIRTDRSEPVPLPATMRAAVHRRYGDPSALEVVDIDLPAVGPKSVLVEVVAAALNPLDLHRMTGTPWLVRTSAGLRSPKDPVTGVDVAGVVVAVGEEVTDVRLGDEVMGVATGACAQYVAVRTSHLTSKPPDVSFDDAAAMGVAGVTALIGIREKGSVAAGQRVLVNGASGGVGTVAVQLAADLGAEVTGVCSTRNVELVRSLGAAHVVDYTTEDFAETDIRYDAIFDNHGNRPVRVIRRILTERGIFVLVGGPKANRVLGPIGYMVRAMVAFAFRSQTVRPFIADERRELLDELAGLMAEGRLRSVIDSVHPLDDIVAAMNLLGTGHARGKIIIRP